jgi:hypothetical protein
MRRTPSPLAIIRFARWKSTFGFRAVPDGEMSLVREGMRLRPWFNRLFRGYDAVVNPK